MKLIIFCILTLCSAIMAGEPVNVVDFGAKGDGKNDDTAAFVAALKAGKDVYVPSGRYPITQLTIPQGTTLRGVGVASTIICPEKKTVLTVESDTHLSSLKFIGLKRPGREWGFEGTALVNIVSSNNVLLENLYIEDYKNTAIRTEHGKDITIKNCYLKDINWGVDLVFSQSVKVTGNTVVDARAHGIQFWGNYNFQKQDCADLIFSNNYVKNGGSGAIWGCGGERVVMIGNIIDGAHDVGLDLEWCADSTIVGNTVTNCANAGISCFYSCKNVTISGNSVVIVDGKDGRRDGIWLTSTNKSTFPGDDGHETISITGNTIVAKGMKRHGIYVGNGKNIVCAGNVLQNADVLDCTGDVKTLGAASSGRSGRAETIKDWTTVLPLSQKWRFAIDPKNEGVSQKWFAPDFKDAAWATVRSDKGDQGWESQGFAGEDGHGYTGYAWYRITLPKLPERRRTFAYLYFGMADEQAWVYVNGKLAGEHTEKSTGKSMEAIWSEPFGISVSEYLKTDGDNTLTVRIHNAALNGGLRSPVYLVTADQPLEVPQMIQAIKASKRSKLNFQQALLLKVK